MKIISAIFLILVCLAGLAWIVLTNGGASRGSGWTLVGSLADAPKYKFVVISADHAKDRATYDSAVNALCRRNEFCTISFFLPGDRIPKSQDAQTFRTSGGFKAYPTVATWQTNDFHQWDCERAGKEGAPLGALCGDGIAEAFSAILSLAGRTGMAEFCNWPKNKSDFDLVMNYIEKLDTAERKDQFRTTYFQRYRSGVSGPDNLTDCSKLRTQVEQRAAEARKLLATTR
jgi:hypothetical protein